MLPRSPSWLTSLSAHAHNYAFSARAPAWTASLLCTANDRQAHFADARAGHVSLGAHGSTQCRRSASRCVPRRHPCARDSQERGSISLAPALFFHPHVIHRPRRFTSPHAFGRALARHCVRPAVVQTHLSRWTDGAVRVTPSSRWRLAPNCQHHVDPGRIHPSPDKIHGTLPDAECR